ncbi:MAG TPA: hypothetical protein VJ180_02960, partial [Pyrinomonadaceae bacterium]|nr:hypothetical protein [Pyrinomonadaceae bacterium]
MTLRDTIESAVNTVEKAQETPVVEKPEVKAEVKPEVKAEVKPEIKEAGRTAGRSRDEQGRLLPGKAEKPLEKPVEKPVETPVVQATPLEIPKPKTPPPSSWKKDHWESWDKIAAENPKLAEYLNQREGEFAKGVSTYKQEYEAVKPLADAIQPLLPTLQQYGINPAQWIQTMGQAHHSLVFGTPQQKLQMFAKLAQDYKVPLQALYDPAVQQQFLMQQTLQPQAPQPDVRSVVQEQLTEVFAKHDLEQFQAAKDPSGNPLYPHYEKVRNTMAQLLEAGVAEDLKSAYDKAIRMHDDIWEAEQAVRHAASEKARQEAQAKEVAKAKAAAVSTRTATPSGETVKATKG